MATVFDINKIEDILQCSICLDRFKIPKVLSCQHTYCLSCLEGMHNRSSKTLQCPQCRKNTTIQKDLNELPINVTLSNLLDLQPIQAKCPSCGLVGSLKICKCCQNAKCIACSEKHAKETIETVRNVIDQLSDAHLKDLTNAAHEQFQTVRHEIFSHFHQFRQEIDSILLRRQVAVVRQLDEYQQQVLQRIRDDVEPLEQSRQNLIKNRPTLESKEQTELNELLKKMLQLQKDLNEKLIEHQTYLNGIDVMLQYNPASYEAVKAFGDAFQLEIKRKPQSNSDEQEPNNSSTDQNNLIVITMRTSLNQEYKMTMSLDTTVKESKRLIGERIKIDSTKIVLMKSENFFESLDDDKTLRFYNCDSSTVLIISIV